jgi:transcriptional antiterminator NusG
MFPSYVFVEMIVTEKSWFIVRNTPKVTGFLGSSGKGAKPVPLPPEEINGILRGIGLMEKPTYNFNVGDKVLITTGPFADKVVEIAAVSEEKEIVTVLIEFLGRPSPTEFAFTEVKKIETNQ